MSGFDAWEELQQVLQDESKDSSRDAGDGRCSWVAIAGWRGVNFLDMPQHVAYMQAVTVSAVSIKVKEDSWQLIVKGKRKGGFVVAFVECATFADALQVAGEYAQAGLLQFHTDKYPPRKK